MNNKQPSNVAKRNAEKKSFGPKHDAVILGVMMCRADIIVRKNNNYSFVEERKCYLIACGFSLMKSCRIMLITPLTI